VIEVNSIGAVTMTEAIITLMLFFVLLISAYAVDKYEAKKRNGVEGEDQS
jgi:hypothetical protein